MMQIRYLILAAIASLFILSACEEDFDPFIASDRDYTMFGTLDMGRDTQYVRVIPIRETLDPGSPAPLDVVFTSTDLDVGEQIVWRDSLVTFGDGSVGHVFYSPLRLRPGHRYRIAIEPSSGDVVTSAETVVPTVPRATVAPEVISFSPAGYTQIVAWLGLERPPFQIDQYYRFLSSLRGDFMDVNLPYKRRTVLDEAGVLVLNLDLQRDKRTLDSLFDTRSVPLAGLGARLTVLDSQFDPPGGKFDPEVLSQPGSMSNVVNGFGFVGAVGRFSVEWLLKRESLKRLGYLTLEELYTVNPPPPSVTVVPFEWSAMP